MLILDAWVRSKLPAKDFSGLVGVSVYTLYKWRQRFDDEGPAGLEDKPKGRRLGSRLSEECKRAILMMKEAHQDWGQDRIHAMLMRTQGFGASASAIGRFLAEEGYVTECREPRSSSPGCALIAELHQVDAASSSRRSVTTRAL